MAVCVVLLLYVSLTRFGECAEARTTRTQWAKSRDNVEALKFDKWKHSSELLSHFLSPAKDSSSIEEKKYHTQS